tara:strand:+ start:608 stop:790 length:183 start_codon:yes stop_codon:yes gene_type:complete
VIQFIVVWLKLKTCVGLASSPTKVVGERADFLFLLYCSSARLSGSEILLQKSQGFLLDSA